MGRLIALNADKGSFQIKTLHFGEVHGRYKGRDRTADLKAVLDSSAQAPLVRITGRMSWLNDVLTQILSVDQVELLEIASEPWSRRMIELAGLAPDWHPDIEPSQIISSTAIDAAREILRVVQEVEPTPGIYPRGRRSNSGVGHPATGRHDSKSRPMQNTSSST